MSERGSAPGANSTGLKPGPGGGFFHIRLPNRGKLKTIWP